MSRHRFRPAALVAGVAALPLVLSACGAGQGEAPAGPEAAQVRIVVSTDAWGSVARAVGGDHVQVDSIIEGMNAVPHGYEATPQDATTVGDAQLILMNGGGYDGFMTGLVDASGSRAPVVDAVEASGLEGVPEAGDRGHEGESPAEHAAHAGEEGADHGSFNEHVWYDPATVQKVAQQLADRLAEIDPPAAQTFRGNAQTIGNDIANLTSKAAEIGRAHPRARVAVTEPVPNYLLDAAGVQDVTPPEFSAAVEEGTDPPAAVVAQMLDLFRTQPSVDALILNTQTQSATTDQVRAAAEQAGVPVIEMSETLPDGAGDYVQWMNGNLDALAEALNR
ncbi:metal ABC transporter solute-binding protein, Zn/Mn family [Pseudonocardia saturnea]|uniref:Zinc/manganese transport system substrate-binding protein n=2 Tax=Pseudonocardia TaxID=1847 RepID=A0ABQ0S996_9PSEU|nr:zinc ABC transporter substrate-binding protein [Pseudonocardia saturnea]TDN65561.1 zinc/manganese transport system substrate-binding protein [Pseudonocardia autotrophica]BBG05693.1 hypothetical protein Pdca_69020 [Pseudonocardia autotrophica]GEC29482.1 hypothetical protein PSA01_65110 [Pseudonocardia saturnea]